MHNHAYSMYCTECMYLHLDYGCGVESLTFKEKVGFSASR